MARPTAEPVASITLRWPWWMHPVWAVLLLTGLTAVIAISLPAESYRSWRTPRYLESDQSQLLILGIVALVVGILLIAARVLQGGSVDIRFTARQVQFLRRAYVVMLVLVAVGYASWTASAISQGVDLQALLGVVSREAGAIGALKADSRPIAGVTTLTQFGPIVVVLGVLLRRIGAAGRWHYWIVFLAVFRGIFYAERLALLEVVIPLVVISSALALGEGRRSRILQLAPLIVAPLAVAFFAVFEYFRSWVYYQNLVDQPFLEWVSLRMLGYYITSYNNSALLDLLLQERSASAPYFTIPFIYNAPIVGDIIPLPSIGGAGSEGFWRWALQTYANPEFTNGGSFLLVRAEWGTLGMVAYWFVTGLAIGAIYVAMRRGSVIATLAYGSVFVGLLELPRFIYWIQGRSTPIVLAIIVLAFIYGSLPQVASANESRRSRLSPTSSKGLHA